MENENIYKKEDEVYCPECGKPIKRKAVVCVYCGVQVGELKNNIPTVKVKQPIELKTRKIAIILAVCVGIFAFIYTYKRDAVKFWLCLGFAFLGGIIVASMFGPGWSFLVGLGFWIYAMKSVSDRPDSFYENYPND
jgi:hypothetical protein